jgi:hypothetical protein
VPGASGRVGREATSKRLPERGGVGSCTVTTSGASASEWSTGGGSCRILHASPASEVDDTAHEADGRRQWAEAEPADADGRGGRQGPGGPNAGGGPPGAPLSPWSRHRSRHRGEPRGPSRGSPAKRGATRHRSAAAALLGGRRRPPPVRAALEGIAKRLERTLNRDQTRGTRGTEGGEVLGGTGVQRPRPTSGKQAIALVPAPSAHPTLRNRLQDVTARRAPIPPQECGARVPPMRMGWGHACRHTNARHACRGLPRFVPIRWRRSVTQRSTGWGCGWPRGPTSPREARGRVDMGRGRRESLAKPAPGVRGSLADRRTRDNCPDGGRGRGG